MNIEYLWNKKKDITKRKTPFYSTLESLLDVRIFEMTYFSVHVLFNIAVSTECRFILQKIWEVNFETQDEFHLLEGVTVYLPV